MSPGGVRPPAFSRRAGRGDGAGSRGRAEGERRRLRALFHRGGADRRHAGRDRGAERGDRRRPPFGAGQGRGRDGTRRPQRGAAPARPGDGEPRRHRPPDDRRRDLDRHPRNRREAAQHLLPGRGGRAGARRRERAGAEHRRRSRAAARGAGGGRHARRDLSGDPALRAGLHPAPGRCPAPARRGARHLPGARRRQRPLRVLHLPIRRQRSGPGAQPDRRAPAPPRTGGRLPQRHRAGELGAGGALGDRQALPRLDPPAGAPRRAPRLRQQRDRPQRPHLRQRAAGPLHRDGVRGAARARAGGGAPGDRVGARQPLPGLLPDRGAGCRGRRRPAQHRARPRHRLHRRTSVPRHGVAPLLRGGRGDHGLLRRPSPLGQAPLPDRRDPRPSLSGLGRVPDCPRRSRPWPHLHKRVRVQALWAESPPGPDRYKNALPSPR